MPYVDIDGGLTINKQYSLPSSVGVAGNSLRIPVSGTVMEWFNAVPAVPELTQLIYGNVVWLENLTFAVSNCQYFIKGVLYNSLADEITLDTADETNPRIDVIYVDTSGLVGIIKGTPAADPAKPLVDPSIQLELTNVYINANAIKPGTVFNTIIYDENIEWIYSGMAIDDVVVDLDCVESPYHSSKCIKIASIDDDKSTGFAIKFTGTVTGISNSTISFYIKTPGVTGAMSLMLTNGTKTANVYIGSNNPYGLSFTATTWQKVTIPITAFSSVLNDIDGVIIKCTFTGTETPDIYLDYIYIQSGISVPTPTLTVADGILDLNLSNNVLSASPYSVKKSTDPGYAYLYTGTTNPTFTNRLNLDGSLHLSQITVHSTNELPALSAELNTNPAGWTCGTNWTNNGNGVYTCTAGAGTLSTTIPTVTGRRYLISWTGTGLYLSNFYATIITLGTVVSSFPLTSASNFVDLVATATGDTTISISVYGAAAGTISNISIKELNASASGSSPVFLHNTSTGIGIELRSNLTLYSQALGYDSLKFLHAGSNNTAFGYSSLKNTTFGYGNTAYGYWSLKENTIGYENVAMGYRSLYSNTIGSKNVAIGAFSNANCTSGEANVGVGYKSLQSLTTGTSNIAIGYKSAYQLTSGSDNIAIGKQALMTIGSTYSNVAIGTGALAICTSSYNTAIGTSAGTGITSGRHNVVIGYFSGSELTTGYYNIFIGGLNTKTGINSAKLYQTDGFTTDTNLILLGVGIIKQNIGSVLINSVAIGDFARIYQSNQVVLGNTEITSSYISGDVEIRNYQIVAANSLNEGTFATHTNWTESGDIAYNTDRYTYTHNTGSGYIKQAVADFATAIKSNTWYKISFSVNSVSGTGAYTVCINSSLNGTIIPMMVLGTSYIYIKSSASTTPFGDFQLDITTTGARVLDVTFCGIEEVTGGNLYVNNDIEQRRGTYQYYRQFFEVDTDGDWRTYSDANGMYFQQRVSGTYTTKYTIPT